MSHDHSRFDSETWTVPGPDHEFQFPEFMPGLVWLVGAGPGDPGLVTVHALNALRQADIVVHDALVNSQILGWCKPGARIVYSGKRGGKPSPQQTDISQQLIAFSRQERRVVRLKGGDPFVFGRGAEEVLALLEAGVPVRATAGVTAGIAGLASVGIPVTWRETNQTVTFLTGHDQSGSEPQSINWKGIAAGSQVIVLYMAMKNLDTICQRLVAAGRSPDEAVAIVTNATLPQETALETTLQNAAADAARYRLVAPAIICVGPNVSLHRRIGMLTHSSASRHGGPAPSLTTSIWLGG